jgi:hypothetical protein
VGRNSQIINSLALIFPVTIMGNSTSSHFKGFMIQAKDPSIHLPVGTFTTNSDAQTLDCFNGTAVSSRASIFSGIIFEVNGIILFSQNSATHVDATEKFMVTVNWVAPDTPTPEVHVV